jgi:exonuclease I
MLFSKICCFLSSGSFGVSQERIQQTLSQCTQSGDVLPPPEEVLLTAIGATKKNNIPGMGGGTRIIKKHTVSDQVSEVYAENSRLREDLEKTREELGTVKGKLESVDQEFEAYKKRSEDRFASMDSDLQLFRQFLSQTAPSFNPTQ